MKCEINKNLRDLKKYKDDKQTYENHQIVKVCSNQAFHGCQARCINASRIFLNESKYKTHLK